MNENQGIDQSMMILLTETLINSTYCKMNTWDNTGDKRYVWKLRWRKIEYLRGKSQVNILSEKAHEYSMIACTSERALSGEEMQADNLSKYQKYTKGCYCFKGKIIWKQLLGYMCTKCRQGLVRQELFFNPLAEIGKVILWLINGVPDCRFVLLSW